VPAIARALWEPLEACHSLVYLEPEPREEYKAIGLRGAWMGYVASRSAALGPVPPEVVIASFYGFHRDLVRRALPDAWTYASPEDVLAARLRGIDRTLRRRLGGLIASPAITQAATLTREAMSTCPPNGRLLFAGHVSQAWPEEPHLSLWHGATLFREFRGDGHVAALLTAGVGPCESLVLHAATGGLPREWLQANRGWSDEEWDATAEGLRSRGWIDIDGVATQSGRAARGEIEELTDRLSMDPWRILGEERTAKLLDLAGRVRAEIGT